MAIFSITTDKETAKIIAQLKEENERYKKALKFYAKELVESIQNKNKIIEQLEKENERLREGLKSIVSSNQSCGDCTLNIMTAKKLLKRSK